MAYALSDEAQRSLQEFRERTDRTFQEALAAHPELANYKGHKGIASWADDGWEDDPA
jgi:hypothetical protein